MSKELDKDTVIKNKKDAIKKLNQLLDAYITDTTSDKHLKKANLISYWLKDYAEFLKFEEHFVPEKNISYKRGNIVKLNFGFNIGSEQGGLHYGVVLDNSNAHSSPVVTVIPLSSVKPGKAINNNSVELGNEIYRLLKLKYNTILKALTEEKESINKILELLKLVESSKKDSSASSNKDEKDSDNQAQMHETEKREGLAKSLKALWQEKQNHVNDELTNLNKIGDEISHMKMGSIALVNQITTVSKIRIFDPRNLKGVLSGITLSEESMEKINQKIKDLYVFEKNPK